MRKRYYDLRPGETVSFDGSRITVEAKTGQRARLCIETPGEITKQPAKDPEFHIPRPELKPPG